MRTNLRAADIRAGVDQSLYVDPICAVHIESKSLGKRQIRAIAALLVPALDSSADGAGQYCHIEHPGNSPLVMHFGPKGITFLWTDLMLSGDILVVLRVLGDQGALLQQVSVLGKALLISEVLHPSQEFMLGNAGERVLDLGIDVGCQVNAADCREVMDALSCVVGGFILWSCLLLVNGTSRLESRP